MLARENRDWLLKLLGCLNGQAFLNLDVPLLSFIKVIPGNVFDIWSDLLLLL